MSQDRIKVMLSTEGTYPFHQGGVSTWCNVLVDKLPNVDYTIYSIIMNPFVTQKFSLPERTKLIKVPLWGTEEPSEHLTTPFSNIYTAKRYTDSRVVEMEFLPLFRDLIEEILSVDKKPMRFGQTLVEMHKFFREYDYRNSFKSEATWEVFKTTIRDFAANSNNKLAMPSVHDLINSMGWLYRFLVILNTPMPNVDVSHSAAAAFCGIPCVLAKLENKTPFLLTEHGVYLREQYLSISRRGQSSYLNTFLVRMIHSVTDLNYYLADQVSPVCAYNTRWEKKFGVSPDKIKVIYNGVDKDIFTPSEYKLKKSNLTVVVVARIDPVKDILTLIRAAAIVRQRIPDIKFIVYGSVSVPDYYEECLALRRELDIEEMFIFAGHTNDIPAAYRSGDVVALSSITEAFPYSVVEAMMSGKPVVATDVGGVKEAVGDCGIVVRPERPDEFARALMMFLENPDLRYSMGKEARERALNYFTIEKALGMYMSSYRTLAGELEPGQLISINLKKQNLLAERGYAFMEIGFWQEAIIQFRAAIKTDPGSVAVPVLLSEIAEAYNKLGEFDFAFSELEKAEAMVIYTEERRIA
ncbi:MAG: GT4 family glycosyltransferase PelF [Peptococcaceae bacterium]|nr:GT4 family glycosyltransferase PelF [Peptococcaceae bacterium]